MTVLVKMAYLFEFKQVGLTLELPHSAHIVRGIPRLSRPPVFYETRLVGGDYAIVMRRVLKRTMSLKLEFCPL